MTDLVLVVATCAFIALCVAYIGWCDRIIGPDEPDRGQFDPDRSDLAQPEFAGHGDPESTRADSRPEVVTP